METRDHTLYGCSLPQKKTAWGNFVRGVLSTTAAEQGENDLHLDPKTETWGYSCKLSQKTFLKRYAVGRHFCAMDTVLSLLISVQTVHFVSQLFQWNLHVPGGDKLTHPRCALGASKSKHCKRQVEESCKIYTLMHSQFEYRPVAGFITLRAARRFQVVLASRDVHRSMCIVMSLLHLMSHIHVEAKSV